MMHSLLQLTVKKFGRMFMRTVIFSEIDKVKSYSHFIILWIDSLYRVFGGMPSLSTSTTPCAFIACPLIITS